LERIKGEHRVELNAGTRRTRGANGSWAKGKATNMVDPGCSRSWYSFSKKISFGSEYRWRERRARDHKKDSEKEEGK